jgi:hypothetical protein
LGALSLVVFFIIGLGILRKKGEKPASIPAAKPAPGEEAGKAAWKKQWDRAMAEAQAKAGAKEPKEAVRILEEALRTALPGAGDLTQAREYLREFRRTNRELLQETERKELLLNRFNGFIAALLGENWDACEEFVDPVERMKRGKAGVLFPLRILAGASKILRLTPDRVGIESIELDQEWHKGQVHYFFLVQDERRKQRPMKWVWREGQWYLFLERPADRPPDPGVPFRRRAP